MKPVIYLDVDDTLLCFPPDRTRAWWLANKGGAPATDVARVLKEMRDTCEVRWMTAWGMSGVMRDEGLDRLSRLLQVPRSAIEGWNNPLSWSLKKPDAVNWTEHHEGRPWVWIEDELPPDELVELRAHNAEQHYFLTNSSKNPNALVESWAEAKIFLKLEPDPWQNTVVKIDAETIDIIKRV